LDELVLMRDMSLDAQRSAQGRLNNLPADADPRLRERLAAETSRHAERHRTLAMVTSHVHQWWHELRLPPGSILEPASALDIALQPGQTVASAIAHVRGEIADLAAQIAQVRAAPMKVASQQAAIGVYLDNLMRAARPRVGFDVRGNARVSFVEDLVVDKSAVLGLLAWILGPEELAQAFVSDIEQEDAPNALTPAERAERLAELAERLLELERHECALLADDESILPRPDVSPIAILNVRIVQAPAAQAVA
jgi:hypothetical protein